MRNRTTRRSFALLLVTSGLSLAGYTGCDGGGGDGDGFPKVPSAACSSCQEAYTAEDCKAWGDLAGCETAEVTDQDTCKAGIAGCSFKNCKGAPICSDDGSAQCASCDKAFSQADCDALAQEAGCDSAKTGDFTACGKATTGCDFLGCDFRPSCD
jgi:hypothetical protein